MSQEKFQDKKIKDFLFFKTPVVNCGLLQAIRFGGDSDII